MKRETLEQLKPKIIRILKMRGIQKAGVFGSYATGKHGAKSDLDILVKPKRNMGFAFYGLAIELEEKLGRKVDLVTYRSLHPLIRKQVLKEEVKII